MAVFQEPTQWDHELGNNADVSILPDDTSATTGVASLQKLFQLINQTPLEAGGVAPEREDINALFKILGDSVFYGMNGGLASYNPAYDYVVGRYVVYNNTLYKCIQANGASSTVVAPDSVSPLGSDYWKDIENQDSTSLIPNQIIQSPVPLTDANLHLLDGALLSGSGAYADYVTMMGELYNADPTATCWTDEATWQASVTAYGVCGKFVWDSNADTLRLPKITGFIEGTNTASELGDLVEAGAPNITANCYFATNGGFLRGSSSVSGAFVKGDNATTSVDTVADNSAKTLKIDASQSNSIYGNSNTIQPQSIKQYFYIVVGTVSKTQIQIDIDNVMSDLALKADTDLSNVSTPVQAFKDMSIDWGMPDWDSKISLGTPTTTNQSITITTDGYLVAYWHISASQYEVFVLDDIGIFCSALFATGSSVTLDYLSNLYPIKAGNYNIRTSNSGNRYNAIYFVPCKGA